MFSDTCWQQKQKTRGDMVATKLVAKEKKMEAYGDGDTSHNLHFYIFDITIQNAKALFSLLSAIN